MASVIESLRAMQDAPDKEESLGNSEQKSAVGTAKAALHFFAPSSFYAF